MGENTNSNTSRLRLLQLVSPSFPIGAFAYSQGLEAAINNGWVKDAGGAEEWICGLLRHSLAYLDIPIYARARDAFRIGHEGKLRELVALQIACREARELQEEDLQLGRSFIKALTALGVQGLATVPGEVTYAVAFACACEAFLIEKRAGAEGFMYAWCENQVMVASRIVPLGQTRAQGVLSACLEQIPECARCGLELIDDEIGLSAPGLAVASAQHETQYARLFRS